jgi:glycosyltransferase involved in cell wall biosynthesis
LKPSVALVAHDVHWDGGMERACAELIRAGADEIDFTVVSNTLSEDLRSRVRWLRVPVIRRPFPLKFALFFIGAALRVIQARSDIVHTVGAIVPNRAAVVTIQFCHAGFRERTGVVAARGGSFVRRANSAVGRMLALIAERWCYRPGRTRVFAAVSGGVAAELTRNYGGVPVVLTPNGVDLDRFAPAADVRRAFRKYQGIDERALVALFVGGDWDRKGLAIAIAGLAVAQGLSPRSVFLWVVGHGDLTAFGAVVRRFGLSQQVRFFGQRTDTERFYQSADVFVLPTMYETFSLAAYEAAACGLPIVATRVSGIDELIGVEEEAGIFVDRTSDSVGAALSRLVLDTKLCGLMGERARCRAGGYTWQRSTNAVLALYRGLRNTDVALCGAEPIQAKHLC